MIPGGYHSVACCGGKCVLIHSPMLSGTPQERLHDKTWCAKLVRGSITNLIVHFLFVGMSSFSKAMPFLKHRKIWRIRNCHCLRTHSSMPISSLNGGHPQSCKLLLLFSKMRKFLRNGNDISWWPPYKHTVPHHQFLPRGHVHVLQVLWQGRVARQPGRLYRQKSSCNEQGQGFGVPKRRYLAHMTETFRNNIFLGVQACIWLIPLSRPWDMRDEYIWEMNMENPLNLYGVFCQKVWRSLNENVMNGIECETCRAFSQQDSDSTACYVIRVILPVGLETGGSD